MDTSKVIIDDILIKDGNISILYYIRNSPNPHFSKWSCSLMPFPALYAGGLL